MRKERRLLTDIADVPPLRFDPFVRGRIEPGVSRKLNVAALWPLQSGDAAHDRGLAGGRRPEQHQNGAAAHGGPPTGGHGDAADKTPLDVDDQLIGHAAQTVFWSE